MNSRRLVVILNVFGHSGILFLLYRWYLSEGAFNYEAIIGLFSYVLILASYIRARNVNFPHLQYYYETHKKKSKGFYTLVIVWNQSKTRTTNEDFIETRLPKIHLLPSFGEVERVEVIEKPLEKNFVCLGEKEDVYLLQMEYWDKQDFVILKFHHTNASLFGKIRTSKNTYEDKYGLDIHFSGVGKKDGSKLELVDESSFYNRLPFGNLISIVFLILNIVCFSLFFTQVCTDLNAALKGILVILFLFFGGFFYVFLLEKIEHFLTPKKVKSMINIFHQAGGYRTPNYIEFPD